METYFDYDRVREEIENLKVLYSKDIGNYENIFLNKVYNPMSNEENWSGNRWQKNYEKTIAIKELTENMLSKKKEQIDYLEYVYNNYKNADSAVTKRIEEWAITRMGGEK